MQCVYAGHGYSVPSVRSQSTINEVREALRVLDEQVIASSVPLPRIVRQDLEMGMQSVVGAPIVDEVRLDAADVVDGSPAVTVIDLPRVSPNFAPIMRTVAVDNDRRGFYGCCILGLLVCPVTISCMVILAAAIRSTQFHA